MSGGLAPSISTEQIYPPDAVYMARTSLFETRMLGYEDLELDLVTAHLLGCLNGRTAIRHEAGCSDEIFAIFRRAGVEVEEETLCYRTAEEANALAKAMTEQGKRLFYPYPLPERSFPDDAHLVTPSTYRFLNAKSNLGAIAPAECLAKRKTLTHEEFGHFEWTEPVFLKGAGDAATGRGFAVQPCRDKLSFDTARRWFAAHHDSVSGVIVEEWVDVSTCWCVGIVITDEDTFCLGGAEQLFASPARQSGSTIDPENALPKAGWALAIQIGEAARKLGYRGIAAFDVGLRRDGRMTVFDPNFRINSSSAQLLFHQSAAVRSGLSASCSFNVKAKGSFSALAKRLEAPIGEGWFVPTCLFDGEKHPLSMGNHRVIGFVLGNSRMGAQETANLFQKEMEA